ncbi:TonB-dependent receptor [Thalassotalea ganghwensis]
MLKTSVPLLAIFVSHNLTATEQNNETLNTSIERIVVSGSRFIESIDEVPATITVISRAQIEEHLKVSSELQSLLATLVPGLAPNTGSSSNSTQTLRGRSPLVMIDGVPQSTPLRNGSLGIKTLDASVIERIEVIKGATSIYGNGAAGGIINYITREAAKNKAFTGKASASTRFSAVKSDQSIGKRFELSFDGRLEKLSYVLNISNESYGLQRDAEGDVLGLIYGLSDAKADNYFAKFTYDIDENKFWQLTYNHYQSEQQSDLVDVTGSVNSGQKTYAVKADENHSQQGIAQGPNNDNLMFKYVDYDIFANTQLVIDAYSQEINNVFFFSRSLANPDEGYSGGQSIIKSDKQGIRVTFNTQVELENIEGTLIYGVDALNDITSQPLVDGRIWVPEMDMTNYASFLQTKWLIDDSLIIKAGIRHEKIDLGVNDYSTLKLCASEEVCSIPVNVQGDTLSYRATTYNLGFRYNISEFFQPFINYSQGADISDIGRLLRTATVTDIGQIQTQASIIDNYELGFVSTIDDLHFEFSAYRSTSELGTTNKYDPQTGVYLPVRAPQEIYGYEALAHYRFTKNLNISASYAWVEGKDSANDVYLGAKQISAPKATLNLNWLPNQQSSLTLAYTYVGDRKRFTPVEGNYVGDQGPINNYHVINASGHYRFNNDWSLFIGIENLLNEDYFPAKSQAYTYSGYNVKGLGTTINLGIDYQF